METLQVKDLSRSQLDELFEYLSDHWETFGETEQILVDLNRQRDEDFKNLNDTLYDQYYFCIDGYESDGNDIYAIEYITQYDEIEDQTTIDIVNGDKYILASAIELGTINDVGIDRLDKEYYYNNEVYYDVDLYDAEGFVKTLFSGTILDLFQNPTKFYDKYVKFTGISEDRYMKLVNDMETAVNEHTETLLEGMKLFETFADYWNEMNRDFLFSNGIFEKWFVDNYYYTDVIFDENDEIVAIDL